MNNLISTEHKKKTMIYNLGNPGPGLDQAHKCGRVKPFKGFYFKLQLSGHIKKKMLL